MKIQIHPYNHDWPQQFETLKGRIKNILKDLDPVIEHIGSTSVPGLAAKPIIDIMVGLKEKAELDKTIAPMMAHHFIYYEIFNSAMPDRRLFVGLKNEEDVIKFKKIYSEGDEIPHGEINDLRFCHIHIWEWGSFDWIRHLAFRDFLRNHPVVRTKYEMLKTDLSQRDWKHGMEYNEAKDEFMKTYETKALQWFFPHGY